MLKNFIDLALLKLRILIIFELFRNKGINLSIMTDKNEGKPKILQIENKHVPNLPSVGYVNQKCHVFDLNNYAIASKKSGSKAVIRKIDI